jgi:hypothetical protein
MSEPKSRYSTIRDYVLLAGGSVLIIASIGEGIVGNVQLAVGFLGGGLTCWGLVPTWQRDRSDR